MLLFSIFVVCRYYAFDDDIERGAYTAYDESGDDVDPNKTCRRISEHRRNTQNCNNVHELDLIASKMNELG